MGNCPSVVIREVSPVIPLVSPVILLKKPINAREASRKIDPPERLPEIIHLPYLDFEFPVEYMGDLFKGFYCWIGFPGVFQPLVCLIGESQFLRDIGLTLCSAGAILVSHNKKHFSRIEGIKVEDWS